MQIAVNSEIVRDGPPMTRARHIGDPLIADLSCWFVTESAAPPGKIGEYFNLIQRELDLRLQLSRLQNTDSEAKGVAAERFLGEILQRYLEPSRPTYRRQIIDSTGRGSDEVDLIFCNWAQPSVRTELLLAEGVDYALE